MAKQLDFDVLFDESNDGAEPWQDPSVKPKRVRKPVCGVPKVRASLIEQCVAEASRRADSGDWEEATPQLLVALYVVCHQRVYSVRPVELGPETWLMAVSMAAKQLRTRFNGDTTAAATFMRWVWDRERNRRDYLLRRAVERQEPLPDLRRISWRLQFGFTSPLLSDYYMARSLAR